MGRLKSTPDYQLITSAAVAVLAGLLFAFIVTRWVVPKTAPGDSGENSEVVASLEDEDDDDLEGFEALPLRPRDPAAEAAPEFDVENVIANTAPEMQPDEELAPCPGDERKPIRLFGDAQVRPSYTRRTMHGVQIQGVRDNSFWTELGIDSGDLIKEQNGQIIDSPQASVDLMNYLESSPTIRLKILTTEGNDRWIDWQAPQPPDPATLPPHCRE